MYLFSVVNLTTLFRPEIIYDGNEVLEGTK